MRSWSRRHGDPLICGSHPLLPRRSCGSSRELAVSPTARHLSSVSAGRQLGGLCRIQHRSSFQGKKKKNLPEQQASGSQRINNGPSSSEPQMEREGGRSPREAPTSPEFGPTKATSWGTGQDIGQNPRCQDEGGAPLAGPRPRPALTQHPNIAELSMVRPTHRPPAWQSGGRIPVC